MNLLRIITDPRFQILGIAVAVFLYLEGVINRLEAIHYQADKANAIERKDDRDWKDEEMRELQDLGREHMELRQMILEYCK